jgi:2-octaprenyl-6-methoxyphenol hydroxylase
MSAIAPPLDLIIVGGGMVGASLALSLANTSRRVALIEPVMPGSGVQPSFDDRTSALANGTRRILETIGAWPAIGPQATPIQRIQVSDAGHFGAARLDAAEQGLPALGYTVSNRVIGAALWQALNQQQRIAIHAPARVAAVQLTPALAVVDLVDARGQAQRLQARLVVAADGAQSLVRAAAGIAAATMDYHQVAIVANLRAERPADGTAYERFTPHGPLAVLPLADGSYTVVWTVSTEEAPLLLAADDDQFRERLQQRFGWRIGALQRVGQRSSYPLALSRAGRSTALRSALVGNAAQALHPVAGQGFNLGLRDAAVLAELVADAADPGAPEVLEAYERRRATDRRSMIHFTDGLVRLFALQQPGVAQLRSLGMLLFDAAPGAKRALSRISWGFGAPAPRLLRGLPLQ